jgi:cytoskeletal protein CcmA (bactofilin family)
MEVEKATLIDADADVEGKLAGKDARILGRFKGEVDLKGRLLLGEGARVEATILADVAEIAGEFKGDIAVRHLVLLEKARVSGTVSAQILAVREGAQLNGSVDATGPAKARPVTAGANTPPAAGAVAG